MISYPSSSVYTGTATISHQHSIEQQLREYEAAKEKTMITEEGLAREAAGAEMHEFAKLMLARMKSNPDEFNAYNSEWIKLFESVKPCMTNAEREAIHVGIGKIRLDNAHKQMMKLILNPPEAKPEIDAAALMNKLAQDQAVQLQQLQNARAQGLIGLGEYVSQAPQSQSTWSNIIGKFK